MVKQIRVLSEKDMDLLQELLDERRRTKKGLPPSSPPLGPPKASQVLIAYPQTADGIPALSTTAPGYADCDIYWIDESTSPPSLSKITGLVYRVYNLTKVALAQDYVAIHQDRSGRWIAGTGGSSSGMLWIEFTPTQTFATTDDAFSAHITAVHGNAPGEVETGTGTGNDVTINNTGLAFSGDADSIGICALYDPDTDAYYCISLGCPPA